MVALSRSHSVRRFRSHFHLRASRDLVGRDSRCHARSDRGSGPLRPSRCIRRLSRRDLWSPPNCDLTPAQRNRRGPTVRSAPLLRLSHCRSTRSAASATHPTPNYKISHIATPTAAGHAQELGPGQQPTPTPCRRCSLVSVRAARRERARIVLSAYPRNSGTSWRSVPATM